MNIPTHMARLKGFRYPREIIAYAVWAYHRFTLSTADVEDLLAARGVIVRGKRSGFGLIALDYISQTAYAGIDHDRTTSGTWTKSFSSLIPPRPLR
jgi:putative transposase